MSNDPTQTLKEIVNKYGLEIIHDPRRCKALLNDYCNEHVKEITVLVLAIEKGVVSQMLSQKGRLPYSMIKASCAKRLVDSVGFSQEVADWAIESWTSAIGMEEALHSEEARLKRKNDTQCNERERTIATARKGAVRDWEDLTRDIIAPSAKEEPSSFEKELTIDYADSKDNIFAKKLRSSLLALLLVVGFFCLYYLAKIIFKS